MTLTYNLHTEVKYGAVRVTVQAILAALVLSYNFIIYRAFSLTLTSITVR